MVETALPIFLMLALGTVTYFIFREVFRNIGRLFTEAGEAVAGILGTAALAGVVAACIAVPLGVLYFLVRFVKWAWAN